MGGRGGAACDVGRSPVRKTVRLVFIFIETAALFMMNKIRGTSQINIDILMNSSRRDLMCEG